jgi:hypothetical protein
MTPDQLHEALYTIGWSQRDLGDRLRVDRETLRGWNQGTTEIPSRVGDWLEYLSDVHEHALLPSGWEFPVKQEHAAVAKENQMSMRVVSTELGVVARETFPSGEQAYRRNQDGSWNHSPDHKGPWIVVPPKDVPERFKDAIAAGAVTDKQPERAPEQQPSEAVMAMSGDRTNAGTLPEKSQENPTEAQMNAPPPGREVGTARGDPLFDVPETVQGRANATLKGWEQPDSLHELPEGFAVIEHEPGSGIWAVSAPDRDYLPPGFMSREAALAWTKTAAFEQAAAQHRKERHDRDADLDRVEHEQGPTVVFWSGDYGAELERLEFDQETQSERGRSEPPERGIEDDEELER